MFFILEAPESKSLFSSILNAIVLILSISIKDVYCGRVADQILIRLEDSNTDCIRMLNGTTSVGCQSNQFGNVGVLSLITTLNELQAAIDNLPLGIKGVIAVIDVNYIDSKLISNIRTSEDVTGIILLDYGNKKPDRFSEDSICPNQQFSFYKNESTCHPWNAKGAIYPEGLRFLSFEKPLRFVSNLSEIDLIVNKCFKEFNKNGTGRADDGLRCVGRMTLFMHAAGNAQLCMARSQTSRGIDEKQWELCDPLQDINVFAMLPPLNQSETQKADHLVLSSRMDTFSSIYDAKDGDVSALGSVIAVLSVANAIGQQLSAFISYARQSRRQLLFAFFHGESLGYIGSSRWVWDIQTNIFPQPPKNYSNKAFNVRQILLEELSFFLELQQIGNGESLFYHTDRNIYVGNTTLIHKMVNVSSKGAPVKFLDPTAVSHGALPPSSYHSLLKEYQQTPGLVMASFGKNQYIYNYLNSIFDDQVRKDTKHFNEYVERITKAAQVALRAALGYVFDFREIAIDEFKIDKNYIETLAKCFFSTPDWNCTLFREILNVTDDQQAQARLFRSANNLYIGTNPSSSSGSLIRRIVFALLVQSLGVKGAAENVSNEAQCRDLNRRQNIYTFVWQNDGKNPICYQTSIYRNYAKSPAFEIEDYDFASGYYSTWVESRWGLHKNNLELYLKADYRLELYAFLTAVLVLMLSIPLYYGLNEQWFMDNSIPPAAPQHL